MKQVDVVVIGAGIVGLAIAREILERQPGASLLVIEKESRVAAHQSGRNSGVIHSGIYYAPKSAKARLARAGCSSIKGFCEEYSIPYRTSGKLIIAIDEEELPALEEIGERGRLNGIEVSALGPEEAKEIEPAVTCLRALHVPSAGVVDFRELSETLARIIEERGAMVRLDERVGAIDQVGGEIVIRTSRSEIRTRILVNAAGLYSDRVARMGGIRLSTRIIPFRGEYVRVDPPSADLVRGLIYPVPDVRYPFLGVHLTRSIHGEVHAGPNAMFALSREGYRWSDISLTDTFDSLRFPGLWRFASRHAGMAIDELHRSLSRARFAASVRRLVPGLRIEDLRSSPAGVRAQALDRGGTLVDDFMIEQRGQAFHVLNAPSPAATSSLEIAREITSRIGLFG